MCDTSPSQSPVKEKSEYAESFMHESPFGMKTEAGTFNACQTAITAGLINPFLDEEEEKQKPGFNFYRYVLSTGTLQYCFLAAGEYW